MLFLYSIICIINNSRLNGVTDITLSSFHRVTQRTAQVKLGGMINIWLSETPLSAGRVHLLSIQFVLQMSSRCYNHHNAILRHISCKGNTVLPPTTTLWLEKANQIIGLAFVLIRNSDISKS